MSMRINENYNLYKTDSAEELKAGQKKAEESGKGKNDVNAADKTNAPEAEYISSEKSEVKPSGLYRVGKDENGNRKLYYDNPKKPAEKCTADTDKVDKEIEKLKEKKKQLEQEIKSASEDEDKVRKLEKKLDQVESELNQKDNDTYRRQHTSFSR
ncbi:MAG: hypothetical protein HFI34_11065 [Lachnospiraceae bacterium]|nr:hypothetical protein [Lachnospiraceae bacterium]